MTPVWRKPLMLRLSQEQYDRVTRVQAALARDVHRCAPEALPRSTVLRWVLERGLELTEKEFSLPRVKR